MSGLNDEQLSRSLRLRETAALTFSTVGATAGIYSLFGFSLSFAGPAFFWGWILVGVGVGAACLIWAELASRMPLAGSVFHWASATGGRKVGWWVGWLYFIAQCWVLTAWYFLVPGTLGPLIGVEFTPVQAGLITFAVIVMATALNALGIELLGRIIFVGVVLELIVAFGMTTWLAIASEKQPLSILFDLGPATTFSDWVPLFLSAGIFLPLWVLFTFESAGAVGEETKNAKRVAPRAVLLAFLGSMIIGIYFLLTVILAIPDLDAIMASGSPLPDIFDAWLPPFAAKIYLALLLGIEILGCNAFFTAVSRQLFGMSRAQLLPGHSWLSRTRRGTPWASIVTVGILTSIPLLIAQTMSVLAGGATAAIYVAYTALLVTVLVARLRGWPRTQNPGGFSLGKWGIPVNILAVVFALGALILLNWPSDLTNPEVGGIRVSYWLIGAPAIVGIVLFLVWRRRGASTDAGADSEAFAKEVEASTDVDASSGR
jgi:amino acid transporter